MVINGLDLYNKLIWEYNEDNLMEMEKCITNKLKVLIYYQLLHQQFHIYNIISHQEICINVKWQSKQWVLLFTILNIVLIIKLID